MKEIGYQRVFDVVTGMILNDDDEPYTIRKRLVMPDETADKLVSDTNYQFYLFFDEDGLETILSANQIIEIYPSMD
ncbi:hypothetical protein [Apilactobacillus nanyangensis]|uniref:hypothetical protein n=1 Tax=Apilactobacillus nanyangensis TaxID=2799579 RepID=UPI001940B998|nr:hypothetical protein [Apilactobacillus nanyangensis]